MRAGPRWRCPRCHVQRHFARCSAPPIHGTCRRTPSRSPGTLDGTETRWRASYRWQPDDTVTEVAPFDADASSPFLNFRLSQPIHITREGSGGLEALLEVRNLLAEGYRPYILSDGSLLLFADNARSVRAGLAFTF